ncbi:hypothetical protein C8D04_1477 [Simplicispira sp. 125]|nr:hypothetical protein C8D04_1477 [Simplicispira sp. 125]REG17186.1 hypothetical protein C8D01_1787 [Simplicispira sp. 110]
MLVVGDERSIKGCGRCCSVECYTANSVRNRYQALAAAVNGYFRYARKDSIKAATACGWSWCSM